MVLVADVEKAPPFPSSLTIVHLVTVAPPLNLLSDQVTVIDASVLDLTVGGFGRLGTVAAFAVREAAVALVPTEFVAETYIL